MADRASADRPTPAPARATATTSASLTGPIPTVTRGMPDMGSLCHCRPPAGVVCSGTRTSVVILDLPSLSSIRSKITKA